jgi:hypothetical protein
LSFPSTFPSTIRATFGSSVFNPKQLPNFSIFTSAYNSPNRSTLRISVLATVSAACFPSNVPAESNAIAKHVNISFCAAHMRSVSQTNTTTDESTIHPTTSVTVITTDGASFSTAIHAAVTMPDISTYFVTHRTAINGSHPTVISAVREA